LGGKRGGRKRSFAHPNPKKKEKNPTKGGSPLYGKEGGGMCSLLEEGGRLSFSATRGLVKKKERGGKRV